MINTLLDILPIEAVIFSLVFIFCIFLHFIAKLISFVIPSAFSLKLWQWLSRENDINKLKSISDVYKTGKTFRPLLLGILIGLYLSIVFAFNIRYLSSPLSLRMAFNLGVLVSMVASLFLLKADKN